MVQLGTIKIQTPNGAKEIPVWEPSDVQNPELRVGTPNGVGALNLKDPSQADLDQIRVQTASGTMAISNAVAVDAQVSRYALDGNVDDSWGSNDGTNNGVSFVNDAIYGQAGELNSADSDYIDLGFGSSFVGTDSFTFSSWVNLSDTSNEVIIGNYDGSTGVIHRVNNGSYELWIDGNSNLEFGTYNTGNWVHFVTTRDSGGDIVFYENGEKIATTNDAGDGDSSHNFAIGRHSASNTGANLDGKVDDIRIYDRALTSEEVEKLFNRGS